MSILLYSKWSNKDNWLECVKNQFATEKIYTLEDNPNLSEIKFAIIWELPNEIFKKLINIKLIFSMGAGVDHIINLPSYNNIPIIRLKDILMAERMSNHILSQILNYQLGLEIYRQKQESKQWLTSNEGENIIDPDINENIKIGILGCGYLGTYAAQNLLKLGYNVQGFKNSQSKKKYKFKIYYLKKDLNKFIMSSDILISILPSTKNTYQFIDKKFLNTMKQKSLLINVGRGVSINENDLINHLQNNKLFYASLDVFQKEPLPKNHMFWKLKNVTITPHIASATIIFSAVKHMHNKYLKFKKNKKIKSDVDLLKGY